MYPVEQLPLLDFRTLEMEAFLSVNKIKRLGNLIQELLDEKKGEQKIQELTELIESTKQGTVVLVLSGKSNVSSRLSAIEMWDTYRKRLSESLEDRNTRDFYLKEFRDQISKTGEYLEKILITAGAKGCPIRIESL